MFAASKNPLARKRLYGSPEIKKNINIKLVCAFNWLATDDQFMNIFASYIQNI